MNEIQSTESRTCPKHVLVVDDEMYLREIISFDLERCGYTVSLAENGEAAIKVILENAIDVILTDIRMPKMDGIRLLKWVREQSPSNPPVILMTAFADISSEEALALGAFAFLKKPSEKDELLDVVASAFISAEQRWEVPNELYDVAEILNLEEPNFQASSPSVLQIGQGGVFISLMVDFPRCFEVVRFSIPFEDKILKGVGQVKWVRTFELNGLLPGVGIECLYFDDESRSIYAECLKNQKPKAYIPLGSRIS